MKRFIQPFVFCTLLLFITIASVSRVWGADKELREPAEPSFSADGAQIVYIEHVTPPGKILYTTGEIWTIKTDGSAAQRLTQDFNDGHPHFSPNGKQIVFVRDLYLWLINADGSNLRRVSDTKGAFSHGAVFSNDGQSLFFVRPAETKFTAEALAKEPLIALAGGDVLVQYDLQTQKERVLLDESYNVQQAIVNPNNDNVIFVLCTALDNNGKPQFLGEKVIAVVHLQGAPELRTVFAPDKEHTLSQVCISQTNNAVMASTKGKYGDDVFLIENGALQKVDGLGNLGDISRDGKIIVGTGLDDKIQWQIVFYNIDAKTLTPLKKVATN